MLEIDEVTAWMGAPYVVSDKISVFQPNIRDILTFGERQYFNVVSTICSTSSNMKSKLADAGINWETVEDFQMFHMIVPSLTKEQTHLVLGDIDLSKFKLIDDKELGEPVLYDVENHIKIDRFIYMRIVEYLRKVHGLTRAHDRTKSKFVHDMAIEMEREEEAINAKKPYKSFLWPLVSSIKARQGYTKQYVLDMQIYELVHEANRLNVIVQADALLKGSYSGMLDVKKIKNFQDQCNWMRDIEHKQHSGQELKEGTY